jgi:transposase
MGNHRANNTKEEKKIQIPWPKTSFRQGCPDRNPICAQNRHRMGRPAQGNGVRLRNDLLEKVTRLAKSRGMGQDIPYFVEQVAPDRPDRFLTCHCRFLFGASGFWGAKTGPNPTDRRKKGSKHHLVTDANGIPLAVKVTGANRHDVTQLLPLVNSIPPIAGKSGRPRCKPDSVLGDRGYDSEPHRQELRHKSIDPILAKRRTENGSGLGIYRWVVERTISWLHQNRRLRIRYEKRPEIHEAFLVVGCIKICWNHLANSSFC